MLHNGRLSTTAEELWICDHFDRYVRGKISSSEFDFSPLGGRAGCVNDRCIFFQPRQQAKLPSTFTLDACRHGGMTELEEAQLTDGQGRALSAHKSRAYEGYANEPWNGRSRLRASDTLTGS